MNDLKLGQLIEGEAQPDAIHVAIAPIVAAERLGQGWHVGLNADGNASALAKPIGVVDPFLKESVASGQKFWLFLYPNTITALRHEWTHPAFEGKEPSDPKEVSKRWLEDIALRCGVSYERMLGAVEEDDYIHMGENESYKRVLDDCYEEFKKHCEVVLGRPIAHAHPFSCSC